jgi:hypothetical protein
MRPCQPECSRTIDALPGVLASTLCCRNSLRAGVMAFLCVHSDVCRVLATMGQGRTDARHAVSMLLGLRTRSRKPPPSFIPLPAMRAQCPYPACQFHAP